MTDLQMGRIVGIVGCAMLAGFTLILSWYSRRQARALAATDPETAKEHFGNSLTGLWMALLFLCMGTFFSPWPFPPPLVAIVGYISLTVTFELGVRCQKARTEPPKPLSSTPAPKAMLTNAHSLD